MHRGRGRGPRTGRRHSLPAIQSPLGLARALPEGSDTFQQALDDLYNHDPAPALTPPSHALNRLSNIVEGDEEERDEDEDERDPIEEVRRLNTRRFSSPVVISQDEIDALRGRTPRDGAKTQKKYTNTTGAAGVADVAGNNTRGEDSYDHQGAMQFIIATILVYSICGVLCTLINRMKRLRGKPHQAYMQDEGVQRYLKSEKLLKLHGRRTKLQYDCELISDTVRKFEEREKLREFERDIASGDFTKAHDAHDNRKKKKRKKKKTTRHGVGGALGHMGLSLFYIQDRDKRNTTIEDCGHVTSADETHETSRQVYDTERKQLVQDKVSETAGARNDIDQSLEYTDERKLLETTIDIDHGHIGYTCTDV